MNVLKQKYFQRDWDHIIHAQEITHGTKLILTKQNNGIKTKVKNNYTDSLINK